MDFTLITPEQEKAAIAKFKEYGVGIVMGRYNANIHDDSQSARFADLIDFSKYNQDSIKNRALEFANRLNLTCNDPIWGDLTTAFTVRDHKDKIVKFTFLDCYLFLRGIYNFRKDTAEFKAKKKKMIELNKFIDENKSIDEKKSEAIKALEALKAEGVELD